MFFDNRVKLKDTHGIIVTSYTSKKERDNYSKLKALLEEIKNTGKDATISKGKILVNDKKYNILQATKLVEKFKKSNDQGQDSDSSATSMDSTLTASSKKREREVSSSPRDPAMKQKKKRSKNKLDTKKSNKASTANIILDEED